MEPPVTGTEGPLIAEYALIATVSQYSFSCWVSRGAPKKWLNYRTPTCLRYTKAMGLERRVYTVEASDSQKKVSTVVVYLFLTLNYDEVLRCKRSCAYKEHNTNAKSKIKTHKGEDLELHGLI